MNSIATLFSYDIYKRLRPETSDRRLVMVGRSVTLVAMVAAIAWSPFVSHFGSLFEGLNKVIGYIAPPITAVFLWGVFWRRASALAALITLWAGAGLGLAMFCFDWFGGLQHFEESTGMHIPFLMIPVYLFVICSLILVVFSYLRPHRHTVDSEALVWSSPLEALRGDSWPGLANYKVVAGILLVTMILLYALFS